MPSLPVPQHVTLVCASRRWSFNSCAISASSSMTSTRGSATAAPAPVADAEADSLWPAAMLTRVSSAHEVNACLDRAANRAIYYSERDQPVRSDWQAGHVADTRQLAQGPDTEGRERMVA